MNLTSRRGGRRGIGAGAFLLVADFATGTSLAPLVAALVGVGYVLLVAWFLLIGARLLGWSGFRRDAEAPRRAPRPC